MKKLFFTLAFVASAALTVLAQGSVSFNNENTFNTNDAITILLGSPVEGQAGWGIGGDKYTVQLAWASGTGLTQAQFDATKVLGQLVTGVGAGGSTTGAFVGNTGPLVNGSGLTGAGFFDAGVIPSPVGVSMPAGPYTMQVYAWYSAGGVTSYAQAVANGLVNCGSSPLFNMNVIASPGPINSTVFPGFIVAPFAFPEPSSLALFGLGGLGMLLFGRKR